MSFNISKGQCTALIGKNGAGKSTLIDIIIGNKKAQKGKIHDENNLIHFNRMAILFQKTLFPKMIKVKELYDLHHALYKNPLTLDEFKEITTFNEKQMDQMAHKLSGGQQRILDFALALIGRPQFLILDEPTTAMDIETREQFWKLIAKLKNEGITILYTSHYIEEVERMADQIVLLEKGTVKINDTPEGIKEKENYSTLFIPLRYLNILDSLPKTVEVTQLEHTIKIKTDEMNSLMTSIIEQDVNLNDIEIQKSSLLEIMFNDNKEKEKVLL